MDKKIDNDVNPEMSKLLTLKQACEILQCHPNTLRQWDKKGILKAIRIGIKKARRYRREDIEEFINKKYD